MARPATTHTARLARLGAAKDRAKKLPRATVLASKPMCELLGISWTQLRDWCHDLPGFSESGAFVIGGNGIEWQFKPVATVNWLLAHFEGLRKVSAKRTQKIRRIVGGDDLRDMPEDMGIDEVAKLIRLSTDLQDAKIKSGALIDANKAATAFTTFFVKAQETILRSAQEQDPTGAWSPEIRESFEDATRSILLRLEQAGNECLRELRGGAA